MVAGPVWARTGGPPQGAHWCTAVTRAYPIGGSDQGQTVLNHYDVLGVEPTADLDAIRRAWKVKIQLLHPDRHHGAPHDVLAEAARETKRVNGAWETLKDPDRRRRYDLQLARSRDPGPPKRTARVSPRSRPSNDTNASWKPPPRPDTEGARTVRVTCTMCSTTQYVPEPCGRFECTKCNTAWQFAKCEGCHKIAHVRERRTNWRCDSCGRQQSSSWGGGAGKITCARCSSRTMTAAGALHVKCGACGLEHVRCACGQFTHVPRSGAVELALPEVQADQPSVAE